jgi:hypothetical protein
MASTAQDASAPLRGPEKKDEDRDEDGKHCATQFLEDAHRQQMPGQLGIPAHTLIAAVHCVLLASLICP